MQKYKESLTALLADTKKQLATVAVYDPESNDWTVRTDTIDQTAVDINEQADASEEADVRISVLNELESRFRLLSLALEKIELGTYGICEISGEPIEQERLDANPAARTCIHHKEAEYNLPL